MARIRSVKPEFWTDAKTGSLSEFAKCLFIGLLNHADDYGVLKWRPAEWRVKIFPYHSDTTPVVVQKALVEELLPKGLVEMFVETADDGARDWYVWIPRFGRHQVINKPSAPLLPGWEKGDTLSTYCSRRGFDYDEITTTLPEGYHTTPTPLLPGREGKGREVGVVIDSSKKLPLPPSGAAREPEFNRFWQAYPRTNGSKADALKRWKKLKLPEHELQTDEMLEAIEAQKAHKAECDRRGVFCPEFPFAQKWLDGRRWENKPSLADIAGGKEPPKQWEAL